MTFEFQLFFVSKLKREKQRKDNSQKTIFRMHKYRRVTFRAIHVTLHTIFQTKEWASTCESDRYKFFFVKNKEKLTIETMLRVLSKYTALFWCTRVTRYTSFQFVFGTCKKYVKMYKIIEIAWKLTKKIIQCLFYLTGNKR